MKIMKKAMAVLLSLATMLSLGVTAFAENDSSSGDTSDATTHYIITAPDAKHDYEIYQIFTGAVAESSLSNVKWGANGINDGTAVTPDDDVPKTVLAALAAVKDGTDAEKLAVIQQYADLTSTPVAMLSHNGTYSAVPGSSIRRRIMTSTPRCWSRATWIFGPSPMFPLS